MQYKQLAPEEQAKIRRILRDQLFGDYTRLAKVVGGGAATSFDDAELLAELRALWAQHREVLSSDFTLPAGLAAIIEHDRRAYLAPDEPLGPLPDPEVTDRRRLVRRIHHQRLALRQLERLQVSAWRLRADDIRRHRRWDEAEKRWVDEDLAAEPAGDPSGSSESSESADLAGLRAKVRRQRHALRRAHRLIDEQRAELGRLVDALVRAAATG